MRDLVSNAVLTYKKKGVRELLYKTIHHVANLKQLWGDLRWFVYSTNGKSGSPMAMAHGCKMALHSHDSGLSRELFIYGVHEPVATGLLKGFVQSGSRFVDIGANIGYYALLEAQLAGPTGCVLAIEPEASNYDLLRRNIEQNKVANIQLAPRCAVGGKNGHGKLFLGRSANWHSFVEDASTTDQCHQMVPMWELDRLLVEVAFQPVDFIRMDIEGYEIEASEGMWQTIERFKPRLMIEVHFDKLDTEATNTWFKALKAFGYRVEFVVDRDQDFPFLTLPEATRNVPWEALISERQPYRVAMCFMRV